MGINMHVAKNDIGTIISNTTNGVAIKEYADFSVDFAEEGEHFQAEFTFENDIFSKVNSWERNWKEGTVFKVENGEWLKVEAQ